MCLNLGKVVPLEKSGNFFRCHPEGDSAVACDVVVFYNVERTAALNF